MKSLLPDASNHPYYIFAPRYSRTSAGIRALHLLCHWLNKSGQRAYVVRDAAGKLHPDCLTPVLTKDTVDHHFAQGKVPVVVYPEVVAGNPAGADCVVRYALNFPGLLGGDTSWPPEDLVFGYSAQLATFCGVPDNVLHMPVIDTSVFCLPQGGNARPREGSCFYAMKYQKVHGQTVSGLPPGSVEITRNRPNSQTPSELAELFRRSEAFYCFENTALAAEAVLCGCPAVFMPNAYLDRPIALDELGWDGFAWGNTPEELDRARRTVHLGPASHQRTVDAFFVQLAAFIEKTQAKAASLVYTRPVSAAAYAAHIREVTRLIDTMPRLRLRDRLKLLGRALRP